jgi:pimeloyl-ACP methyl ester carboxylesterase
MGHVHTPADGVSIDASEAGSGRPLVLVHGITESRRSWDPVVAPLVAAGYRVVSFDLRGHGDSSTASSYDLGSMSADLSAVIAAHELDSPLLVGHSLGGAVVSAAAASGVDCRGVVNVDQPLALAGFKAALAPLEPMLRGTSDEFDAAIGAVFEQMVGPLDERERSRISAIRQADQQVVLGVWDLVLTSTPVELDAVVDALAGSITVPYLSLHGIDPGPDYEPWLTSRISSATVEVWPDHGHYPHLVDVDRFVARIVEFDPA